MSMFDENTCDICGKNTETLFQHVRLIKDKTIITDNVCPICNMNEYIKNKRIEDEEARQQ